MYPSERSINPIHPKFLRSPPKQNGKCRFKARRLRAGWGDNFLLYPDRRSQDVIFMT
jgi:hypothetical protein